MSRINITVNNVESKSELKQILRNLDFPNLIIGEDSEVENNFCIFRGELDDKSSIIFEIGVISEGHGLKPECKIVDEKYVCIGLNKEIHIFDIHLLIHHKVILDSLFYKFIVPKQKGKIIALHELGLTCVSLNGRKIWEHETELINNYNIKDGNIELITDESHITILESTGEIISKIP